MTKSPVRSLLVAGSSVLLTALSPDQRPAHATTTGPAFPTTPFSADITLTNFTGKSAGPATGTLGVTSITATNLGSTAQQVVMGAAKFTGNTTCGGTPYSISEPAMNILVPAFQTIQLTYPTPLVFAKVNGISCISVEEYGSQAVYIRLLINGYSQ